MTLALDAARQAKFTWRLPATVVRWIDGDTMVAHVALSPKLELHEEHVRMHGVNTPELHAKTKTERARAVKARERSEQLAPPGLLVTLEVEDVEKYGRLLARVILPDGAAVGDVLIAESLAKPMYV